MSWERGMWVIFSSARGNWMHTKEGRGKSHRPFSGGARNLDPSAPSESAFRMGKQERTHRIMGQIEALPKASGEKIKLGKS